MLKIVLFILLIIPILFVDAFPFNGTESELLINPLMGGCHIVTEPSEVYFGEIKRDNTSSVKTIELNLKQGGIATLSVDGAPWKDINGINIMSSSTTQFWIDEKISGDLHTPLTTLTNTPIDVGDFYRNYPLLFHYNVTVNTIPNASSFFGNVTQNISFDVTDCI